MSEDISGLGTPSHIGVVVKDLNKTAEYYTSMWGLGPWQEVEISPTKEELLAGEPFKFKVASAQWGPVGLELLQEPRWWPVLATRGFTGAILRPTLGGLLLKS